MTFSDGFIVILLLLPSAFIFLKFHQQAAPDFPISCFKSFTHCYPLSIVSLSIAPFTCPSSAMCSGYGFTSGDLELLEATNEREQVTFAFLSLGYITQYDCFSFCLFPWLDLGEVCTGCDFMVNFQMHCFLLQFLFSQHCPSECCLPVFLHYVLHAED